MFRKKELQLLQKHNPYPNKYCKAACCVPQDATNRSKFVNSFVSKNSISSWIYLFFVCLCGLLNNIWNDFLWAIINETGESKLEQTNTRSIPQKAVDISVIQLVPVIPFFIFSTYSFLHNVACTKDF